jgi:diguanylate cyclase (GGDEF)-like protein
MAVDISKNLEKAKKALEKNRPEEAIEAYKQVLRDAPGNPEVTQALGDLYIRINQPGNAAIYYGALFDMFVEGKDEGKALALYTRFLQGTGLQAPERVARYAYLLQKQNKIPQAIEQFTIAGDAFTAGKREQDAMFCWERVAQLAPDDLPQQLRLAEVAERLEKQPIAARAYLRAGQLSSTAGAHGDAVRLLGRAHELTPGERSVTMLYADAQLKAGNAEEAAKLLETLASPESDAAFLETYADALTKAGKLDTARAVLEKLFTEKNAGEERLFELAGRYAAGKEYGKTVETLQVMKKKMFAEKRQNDFAVRVDALAGGHKDALPIIEYWVGLYNELNRESKYFEALVVLFDLALKSGDAKKAQDCLERMIDIDAYDHRNQERFAQLKGKIDDGQYKNLAARLGQGEVVSAPSPDRSGGGRGEGSKPAPGPAAASQQALEDLIVQTEIFLQYSLQNKAIERLQRIAEMFPGEEERNERLRNLYEAAHWWPAGAPKAKGEAVAIAATPVTAAEAPAAKAGAYSADTLRDLSKISEITQKIFRQQTPRAMLNTAVNEIGQYLKGTRSLAVIGAPGRAPEMAAEYCAAGVKPAPGAQVVFLISQVEKATPDGLGGLIIEAAGSPILKELGLATAMGVSLTDRETQQPAAMLLVAHEAAHEWKPNEIYFLQAVGDQMLMSVSHTRLRSLVRRMGVADERSGLLGRGSYQNCLLTEADRARTQGTPLSMAILQIDKGAELLRQQGEGTLEKYVEQLAKTLQPIVRQNDVAVKYTAWALAFILPDTTLAGAQNLADKLRRTAQTVKPPWNGAALTVSAAITEAAARLEFDSEDVVTDLINRAEAYLEEARKRGGNVMVAPDTAKA